ncbi:CopG family transcriptional regulator [Halogeometricum borinquense]|uniref:CopG family transcriptional regulator n=1 Tax=Halogeometricum borinquense TaxID=60847 RepID=A0A482T564_9EURY|nr:ribbon-helix-helix domain-containing protein [Halogeometricum borinquense]RYJ12760.1 CopG family transcriptional regulator [Halogeometricum borinquense]
MALSVNVTISMPPEMVEKIDEQANHHGMSRAEYVRHLAREAPSSPFETPQSDLSTNAEV